jgi:hypothetical protein
MIPTMPGMQPYGMNPGMLQLQQQQQQRSNALHQLLPGLVAPSVQSGSSPSSALPSSISTPPPTGPTGPIIIKDYTGNPDVGVSIPLNDSPTTPWSLRINLPNSTDAEVLLVAKTKTALGYNNGSRLVVTGPYICYALNKGKNKIPDLLIY